LQTVFHQIRADSKPTTIRVTQHNECTYAKWSSFCEQIAANRFVSYRAADIERGIFHLVQSGRVDDAAGILHDASVVEGEFSEV
jgi:hypothetical protein